MKRRIISFILAVAMLASLVSVLTSCHGNKKPMAEFSVPESFDGSKKYEISFWAKSDTNIRQTKVYQKAIADFEKLYPNVDVKLKIYTDYQRIYNDVITNIHTSTTPNVCISYPDHIATYMQGEGVMVPLDKLIDDEKFGLGGSEVKFDSVEKGDVIEKFLAEGVLDGSQMAIPFVRSSEAVYLNKTYIEKMGYTIPERLTWEFIFEVSQAAMEKNPDGTYKVNGQSVLVPFIYKSTDNMMIQMLAQLGAGYSTEDGRVEIFNDTTEQLLYMIAESAELGAFSTFRISSYPGDFLNAGQCLFAIDSTAGAQWMGSEAPLADIDEDAFVDFETAVYPLPQFDTEADPKMISQGPSICIFNKEDPGEVLASWLFAQYLLTNEVQISYAMTEGYVPVTSSAQSAPEYLDYLSRSGELDEDGSNYTYYPVKIAATKILLENVDNTFITPVFNGSASLRNAAGQMIEDVTGAVRSVPKKTVDAAYIDALYEKMSSLYHLDELAGGTGTAADGGLPAGSVALLVALSTVWVALGTAFIVQKVKKRKK